MVGVLFFFFLLVLHILQFNDGSLNSKLLNAKNLAVKKYSNQMEINISIVVTCYEIQNQNPIKREVDASKLANFFVDTENHFSIHYGRVCLFFFSYAKWCFWNQRKLTNTFNFLQFVFEYMLKVANVFSPQMKLFLTSQLNIGMALVVYCSSATKMCIHHKTLG